MLKKYNVIHQTGRIVKTKDYLRLKEKKDYLEQEIRNRYLIKPYFYNKEMSSYLPSADLVISRAGAHIVYELMVLKKSAILIPIPWVYKNEQFKNALLLKKLGIANLLSQKLLTMSILINEINYYFKKPRKSKKTLSFNNQKLIKTNAAEKMVDFIQKESQTF